MSIFENISYINEGEQAEEYKARKAKEAEDRDHEDKEKAVHRAGHVLSDTKIKNGKMIDTDEHIKKNNGIHHHYSIQHDDDDFATYKSIDTPRSGFTNKDKKHIDEKEKHYWDKEHRDGARGKETEHDEYYSDKKSSKDDYRRDKYAQKVAKRQDYSDAKSKEEKMIERDKVRDAVNRNMRRHPENWNKDKPIKHEFGIFESVSFLND